MQTRVKLFSQIPAWVGSPADLTRITEIMESEIAKATTRDRDRISKALDDAGGEEHCNSAAVLSTEDWILWRDINRTRNVKASATSKDGKVTYTGQIAEVLAEADHRPLSSLHLTFNSEWNNASLPSCRLGFDNKRFGGAVRLFIEAADHSWATGLQASIMRELRSRQPWWSPALRSAGGFLFLVPMILLAWSMQQIFDLNLILYGILTGIGSLSSLMPQFLLPHFEIIGSGETSTGTKRLSLIAGTLAALASIVGILVSL